MKASVPPFRVNGLLTFRQKLIYREELLLVIVSITSGLFRFCKCLHTCSGCQSNLLFLGYMKQTLPTKEEDKKQHTKQEMVELFLTIQR